MKIDFSELSDLPVITEIYNSAIDYQTKNGYNLWPKFNQQLFETEIKEHRHFKITEEKKIACIFSVVYTDPIIWEEKDHNDAVYLHRIATNPDFKGKQIITHIINWAKEHAISMNRPYIRMDTWGDNETLSNYYIRSGFTLLGKKYIGPTTELSEHYWGIQLNLFEIKV